MEQYYDFFLIGIIGVLLIFCFRVGLDKMMKIIIGNYILIALTLALTSCLELSIFILENKEISFINKQNEISNFINNNSIFISLGFYLIFLVFIFTRSKIGVEFSNKKILNLISSVFFAPLAAISIIIGLSTAIFGIDILNIDYIIQYLNNNETSYFLYNFLLLTPLRIFLPGTLAILLSSSLKVRNKKQTTNEQISEGGLPEESNS